MLLSFLFMALAAFFNACMDAFENENFGESIFKGYDKKFWYKRESWKFAKRIFGYKVDAWHLAKTAMIFSIALALATRSSHLINWWADVAVDGVIWIATFNLFYHKIFKIT